MRLLTIEMEQARRSQYLRGRSGARGQGGKHVDVVDEVLGIHRVGSETNEMSKRPTQRITKHNTLGVSYEAITAGRETCAPRVVGAIPELQAEGFSSL